MEYGREIQSIAVNWYPDNSDLHLIRMDLRRPFRADQSTCNAIRLIRISYYSYNFIRSLAIRIKRIPLYQQWKNEWVFDFLRGNRRGFY